MAHTTRIITAREHSSPQNDENTHWLAGASIYREMPDPQWYVKQSSGTHMFRLALKLPAYRKGIPACLAVRQSGRPFISKKRKGVCTLIFSPGIMIKAAEGIVFLHDNNVIEIKEDTDRKLENAILRSAPPDIYEELRHCI